MHCKLSVRKLIIANGPPKITASSEKITASGKYPRCDELQYDNTTDDTTTMYDKMRRSIHHAVESVLPTVKRKQGIKRKVSDKTKALYEKRTRLRGQGSKEQYDDVQKEIKQSSLADFDHWVEEWAGVMGKANGRGDTRAVYNAVRTLGGKPGKPPTNLTTN